MSTANLAGLTHSLLFVFAAVPLKGFHLKVAPAFKTSAQTHLPTNAVVFLLFLLSHCYPSFWFPLPPLRGLLDEVSSRETLWIADGFQISSWFVVVLP